MWRRVLGALRVGVAVPRGSRHRVEPGSAPDYRAVSLAWFSGANWRVHPDWRTCFVNRSPFPCPALPRRLALLQLGRREEGVRLR